jgi:hypothetical protein
MSVAIQTELELTFPTDWDITHAMMNDEELSATSHEEASKVFERWQTDEQEHDMDIMELDEQMGSKLFEDDIFHDPCASPTGPLEELVFMNLDDDEVDRFSLSLLSCADDSDDDTTSSLPFEERYKATLEKLSKSMQRSQETRKSLKMKTNKTEKYSRSSSVSGVLSSIEMSTQQLQIYLRNIQRV